MLLLLLDGSWTGGGIDPVTLEYKDNLHVSHHSYMTFLIYLNGDFTGGGELTSLNTVLFKLYVTYVWCTI